MISSRGEPSPRVRAAALVTVGGSTLSSFTGMVGGRSKAARKPWGLSRPMSLSVASKVMAMKGFLVPPMACKLLSRILARNYLLLHGEGSTGMERRGPLRNGPSALWDQVLNGKSL